MEANFLLDSIKGRIIFFSLRRSKPKFIASMDFRVFRSIFWELHKNTACFWLMFQKMNCGLSFNQRSEGSRLHTQRKRTSEHQYVQTAAAEGHVVSLRFFFLIKWWQETRASSRDTGNILGDWKLLCGSGEQPLRKDSYYEHQTSMYKLS